LVSSVRVKKYGTFDHVPFVNTVISFHFVIVTNLLLGLFERAFAAKWLRGMLQPRLTAMG
jgi:hypothetical protein